MRWSFGSVFRAILDAGGLTATRKFSLPDKDGTLALASEVAPTLGTDGIIRTNGTTINEDITFVADGKHDNGCTFGPVTIASGKTVTISDGCTWRII